MSVYQEYQGSNVSIINLYSFNHDPSYDTQGCFQTYILLPLERFVHMIFHAECKLFDQPIKKTKTNNP